MMLQWLKQRLRAWLLDEQPVAKAAAADADMLTCVIDGEVKRVAILGVVGMSLQVHTGKSRRLITASHAVDKDAFWRTWQTRNKVKYRFEDGGEFHPPVKR